MNFLKQTFAKAAQTSGVIVTDHIRTVDDSKSSEPIKTTIKPTEQPAANEAQALENALLKPQPGKPNRIYLQEHHRALADYKAERLSAVALKRILTEPTPYVVPAHLQKIFAELLEKNGRLNAALAELAADPDGKKAYARQQSEITAAVLNGGYREISDRDAWTPADFREDIWQRRRGVKEALREIVKQTEAVFSEIAEEIAQRAWTAAKKLLAVEKSSAEAWGAELVPSKQLAALICAAAHPEVLKKELATKFRTGKLTDLKFE